jgi:hypothetical protein
MKTKLSLLAFLSLFSVDSFANCTSWGAMARDTSYNPNPFNSCNAEEYQFYTPYPSQSPITSWFCQSPANNKHVKRVQTTTTGGPFVGSLGNYYTRQVCSSDTHYINVPYCPEGSFTNLDNVCQYPIVCPAGQYATAQNTCADISYPYYTGNKDGCNNFGGLYYDEDGTCMDPDDWSQRLFKDTDSYLTAGLVLGGVALLGGAAIAGGVTLVSAASTSVVGALSAPLAASILINGSAAGGVAYSLYDPVNPQKTISNDSGTATKGIRVDLKDYKVSDKPESGGYAVTQTNTQTGKVEKVSIVPDNVIQQMQNPANINPDTRSIITPIDTTGMQEIEYNYEDNIATVTTHTSPSTVVTKKTSFTTSQNTDGTVSTIPATNIAPSVSGENGGTVVNYNYTPATPSGGTSSNPTSDKDYTGVLNDIKTADQKSESHLKNIADGFEDGEFDGSLSDGSDQFGNFDGQIKGSFSGFVYTDPLGISNMGSGQNVPTYSFTLLGQTFVIFDQNLFNKLPLDLIKNILLFVAAVGGFITVVSFGA